MKRSLNGYYRAFKDLGYFNGKYMVQGYPTIGIECHVQLKTKTKLFAGVENDARAAAPNTLINPYLCYFTGVFITNAQAVTLAIRAGLCPLRR